MKNRENYYFTKRLYWDLMIFFRKKEQTEHIKNIIKDLENNWAEIDNLYLPFDKK